MDHYARLGVSRGSDARDIARAFRRAARHEHPDSGGDVERFRALEEAYRVLINPELRRVYDLELDGGAPDWDDVAWGVEVVQAPPEAGDADHGGLDWDDDLGWGDDGADGVPREEGRASTDAEDVGSRRLDPFVGGPVSLPDPLAPAGRPEPLPGPGVREVVTGLSAAALAAVACVAWWIDLELAARATGEPVDEEAMELPLGALMVLIVVLALYAHHPSTPSGHVSRWLLLGAFSLAWFLGMGQDGWTGFTWVSVVAGPGAVALAVVWAALYRSRIYDPARVAAVARQSTGWRIDRHHRAEEWNRVRAALQMPGRTAVLVGPAATDASGHPVPWRRWTFDPRTGAQEVRLIGDASTQGSWVVVDADGRVVATAPERSLEAWLDVLQEG